MAQYQEEVYIIERKEISEDEDDVDFEQLRLEQESGLKDVPNEFIDEELGDDDDLNDFYQLKKKTDQKVAQRAKEMSVTSPLSKKTDFTPGAQSPRTLEREVVIDDFIRNFLTKMKMQKTMNIFQNEWFELQKKNTFQDLGIGLITDVKNKNQKMEAKIQKMTVELKQAKAHAESAKSTWEKLRKERDFHKHHQDRVNGEKIIITANIKAIKTQQEELQERIDEIKKKHLQTVKEKALIKLEKDKLQRKCQDLQDHIKATEEAVQQKIKAAVARGQGSPEQKSTFGKSQKMTPFPDDARPNPFLSREYENLNSRLNNTSKIDAHTRGIGGMALHMRKQIIASASDDCLWKIWNMDTGENIMTGEGHKDWLSGIDFHPAGSHLVTSGSDRCIKLWDFMASSISHTFTNVATAPIWRVKFHDTGDFVLSSDGAGAIKLFDLHAVKLRQQYRSHTDSVNGLAFQPFTNFFVSGSADKTLSIWDMRTGLTVQTFYGHLNSINDTQFSIGGQYIASADSDGVVKVWDIRMVQEIQTIDVGDVAAHCVAFDKTGKMLAVGCADGEIKMIQIDKGNEVSSKIKAHENTQVTQIIVNQENNCVYSAGGDGVIKVWQ